MVCRILPVLHIHDLIYVHVCSSFLICMFYAVHGHVTIDMLPSGLLVVLQFYFLIYFLHRDTYFSCVVMSTVSVSHHKFIALG